MIGWFRSSPGALTNETVPETAINGPYRFRFASWRSRRRGADGEKTSTTWSTGRTGGLRPSTWAVLGRIMASACFCVPRILRYWGWRAGMGEDFAAGVGDRFVASRSLFAQSFELAKIADGVEVGEFSAGHEAGSTRCLRPLFVGRDCEDHDVARFSVGRGTVRQGVEARGDGPVEQAGRVDALVAQAARKVAVSTCPAGPCRRGALPLTPNRAGGSYWSWSRFHR